MASLQKTFTGDLTTAIAGKLYEAIRDADNKNEQTDASEDVKKAAAEVKQLKMGLPQGLRKGW